MMDETIQRWGLPRLTGNAKALLAALVLVVGLMAGAYGARDQLIAAVRTERTETLAHYVTREDWLTWQLAERARRDQQYYSLLRELHGMRRGR